MLTAKRRQVRCGDENMLKASAGLFGRRCEAVLCPEPRFLGCSLAAGELPASGWKIGGFSFRIESRGGHGSGDFTGRKLGDDLTASSACDVGSSPSPPSSTARLHFTASGSSYGNTIVVI